MQEDLDEQCAACGNDAERGELFDSLEGEDVHEEVITLEVREEG